MIPVNCEQGTEEWFALRAGRPSASNFDKLITSKGEPSKQAEKYMYTLAIESITKSKESSFSSSAMERGIAMESEAKELYCMLNDLEVEEVGFCFKDERKLFGVSPDGLVGDIGLIEIKCPQASTHCKYLLDNKLPTTYFQQVQGQLWVTGRQWCDFVSYYPAIKPLIIRVEPDLEFHRKLEEVMEKFCKDLSTVIEKIR